MNTFLRAGLLVALLAATTTSWADDTKSEKNSAAKPDKDGWYTIFNGKDFDGWKKSTDHPDTFQVVDGEIVVKGPVCHLFYDGPVGNHDFKNFEWSAEVMTKPHANSGMYFHTKYQKKGFPDEGIEVQVNNSHSDPIRTASLYRIKNIMNDSPAKDNEWFTQDITVKGKTVTVKVNGKVVNEYTESDPPKLEKGWENRVISHGTVALQGHDPGSEIHYRNIKIKPLP